MLSMSIRSNRSRTSLTTLLLAMPCMYMNVTSVFVTRPTFIDSIHKSGVLMMRRTIAVFVPRDSVNAPFGPRTTISVVDSAIERFSPPAVLALNACSTPSTKIRVSPAIKAPNKSSKLVIGDMFPIVIISLENKSITLYRFISFLLLSFMIDCKMYS